MNIVFNPRFLASSWAPLKTTPEALFRLKILEKYHLLRKQGLNEQKALEILEVKRSTFFRWKKIYEPQNKKSAGLENKSRRPFNFRKAKVFSHSLVSHILQIRQEFPMWGRAKITNILHRKGIRASESTVQRVLNDLLKRKKIYPVALLKGKKLGYRKEQAKRYAQRWKFQRPKEFGEMIQIDHMSVSVNSELIVKEFKAICPISRIVVSKQYKRATARNAKDFLKHLEAALPFKIKSIQTDGGSEFKAEFEQYCQEKEIEFFVLPPRSPKHNGKIERANGTYRYEFYESYKLPSTLTELRPIFEDFEHHYNHTRPHQALNNLTPMEYFEMMRGKVA